MPTIIERPSLALDFVSDKQLNHFAYCINLSGYWMSRRMTTNIEDLEKNAAEKKLFDPVKAKAQMEVYKEIYRLEEQEGLSEE